MAPKTRSSRRSVSRVAQIVIAVCAGLLAAAPCKSAPSGFSLQELSVGAPFVRVLIWAPPKGSRGAYDALLLLHGSQPPSIPNPNWFAELRHSPPFDQKILIVPAVEQASPWSQTPVAEALSRLLDQVKREYPVNPGRIFVAGFSSGASQGFQIAAELHDRIAGFAALAGVVPRSMPKAGIGLLRGLSLMLVCMEFDVAVPCSRTQQSAALLIRAGVDRVITKEIPGIGHECPFDRVGPVLARWMAETRDVPR